MPQGVTMTDSGFATDRNLKSFVGLVFELLKMTENFMILSRFDKQLPYYL